MCRRSGEDKLKTEKKEQEQEQAIIMAKLRISESKLCSRVSNSQQVGWRPDYNWEYCFDECVSKS